MWIDLAFVLSGFMFDLVLRIIFPIDTSLRFLVFIPNLGFLAFLMVSIKKPLLIAVISAAALGLGMDLLQHQMVGNVIAYPLSIYIVKFWSSQLNESLFEQIFMGITGLFIKELTQYLILFGFGITNLYLNSWFIKREFLTLIGHVPLMLGLAGLNRFKYRAQKTLALNKQRRERVLWNPTLKP
jgi:rod shape-determining protein MreD